MGKIFCLMGKSSSGKDTIFKRLIEDQDLNLKTIVSYTTRPIRDGEEEGVEYLFVDDQKCNELQKANQIIELREYNTCYGIWKYFTASDNQINLQSANYLIIGTLDSYIKLREYYGKENLVPIMITLDDGLRLQRALDREKEQENPRYEEMCRRYLADAADFSMEKMKEVELEKFFDNEDLETCIEQIKKYVNEEKSS